MAERFWGKVFEGATTFGVVPSMWPIVLGNGLRTVVTGRGTFQDGVDEVAERVLEPMIEKAGEFGDRHSGAITREVIREGVGRGADILLR